jgi:hypothetical protein
MLRHVILLRYNVILSVRFLLNCGIKLSSIVYQNRHKRLGQFVLLLLKLVFIAFIKIDKWCVTCKMSGLLLFY